MEGAGVEEIIMGVWIIMEMVGMVDVAMVVEGVVVQGVALSSGVEDGATVDDQLVIMIMVNMMHCLPNVAVVVEGEGALDVVAS